MMMMWRYWSIDNENVKGGIWNGHDIMMMMMMWRYWSTDNENVKGGIWNGHDIMMMMMMMMMMMEKDYCIDAAADDDGRIEKYSGRDEYHQQLQ